MSDVYDRLDEYLDQLTTPLAQDEGWHITTMGEASWASRKLRSVTEAMSVVDEWEKEQIARIKEAAEKERKQHERSRDFFLGHLRQWLEGLIQDGRPTKSITLPGGTISLRQRKPTLEVDDERAIRHLQEAYELDPIEVKQTLNKTKFRKVIELMDDGKVALKSTGEIVDYARWGEQEQSVSFRPAEGEATNEAA